MFNRTAQGQDMMEQLRVRRDELEQAVHSLLKPEIDYTMVDERRLCLLKPGAEKLCDYFGYIVQYDLVQSSASHVNEQAMYIVKAILTSWQTGEKVSEGLGLASSQESRYEGQSSMDVANTILKMAKKRAMVDAVISAVGGSFLFTQDLEDRESNSQPMQQNNGSGFQQNKGGQYTGTAIRKMVMEKTVIAAMEIRIKAVGLEIEIPGITVLRRQRVRLAILKIWYPSCGLTVSSFVQNCRIDFRWIITGSFQNSRPVILSSNYRPVNQGGCFGCENLK